MFANISGEGVFKQSPEDFDVSENLKFEPEGQGDHVYLYVQKTGANTEWLQRQLARIAELSVKDVGYAGLKDRHAVCRQWFSLYSPHRDLTFQELPEGIQVLTQTRGKKKLKQVAVRSNTFKLKIYYSNIDKIKLNQQLTVIRERGFPNFFGNQRFGKDAANLNALLAVAKGKRLKPALRSLAISAGRSYLFNLMLNARVKQNTWDQWIEGDVAILNDSRSIFPVEIVDEELSRRLREFDIHPALPLYGLGEWPSQHEQRLLEQNVYSENPELVKALEKLKIEIMPRAGRVLPRDMQWTIEDECLQISFTLGAGSFATTLLEQVFDLREPERI